MAEWFDNTGVLRKYGPEKALPVQGGEFVTTGALRELEFTINPLTLTATTQILDDVTQIPKGVQIEEMEAFNAGTVPLAGASTITIGLIKTDRQTVPAGGANALVDGATLAQLTAVGSKLVMRLASGVPVGLAIGTTMADTYLVTIVRGATAFTAGGPIKFKIKYRRN